MIGRIIEQYTILEKLGSGGMGSVYKAHDRRLDRPVALKFLHLDLNDDTDANRRFQREAKAASALDHPNICTVYDIGQTTDGQWYIAMACYEGETLETTIKKGSLSIGAALHIGIQIGEGLRAAHSAGVVHRDIKPANVIVTSDGAVKIVDFGLAKAAGSLITQKGSTIGTTAYMSPEQLQGETVDHQTDIWSFGVVLYELITGSRPFDGVYPQAVMYAILNQDPESIDNNSSDFRAALSPILVKCLDKKKALRYASFDVVLADLMLIVKDVSDGSLKRRKPAFFRSPMRMIAAFVLLVFSASVAGSFLFSGYFSSLRSGTGDIRLDLLHRLELTGKSGFAENPTFSPDGDRVAYVEYVGEDRHIWTEILQSRRRNRLTSELGSSSQPSWSPDGTKVVFNRRGMGIFLISESAQSSDQLTTTGRHPVWSPESNKIAYDVNGDIYSVSSTPGLTLNIPDTLVMGTGASHPFTVWSPNGKYIIFWHRAEGNVFAMNIETGIPHSIGIVPTGQENRGLSITENGELFFSIGPYGGEQILWVVRVNLDSMLPIGEPRMLTDPLNDVASCVADPVVGPGAQRLVCTFRVIQRQLYSIALRPGTGRPIPGPETDLLTFAGLKAEYPAFSMDGSQLLWTSHERSSGHLFIHDFRTDETVKVTTDHEAEHREVSASFSAFGDDIFFSSTRDSVYTLSFVGAIGNDTGEIILPPPGRKDVGPSHSPTRKELAFYSNRSGDYDIWTVPIDHPNPEPTQLTTGEGSDVYPSWTQDGNRITYVSDSLGTPDIWIMDRDGTNKEPLVISAANEAWPIWHPTHNWLYYVSNKDGEFNVYMKDMDSGDEHKLTDYRDADFGLPERDLFTKIAVSEDRLIVPLERRQSQIVVVPILRD